MASPPAWMSFPAPWTVWQAERPASPTSSTKSAMILAEMVMCLPPTFRQAVNSPAFATPVGVVAYAHRNMHNEPVHVGAGAFGRLADRLRTLFKEFF